MSIQCLEGCPCLKKGLYSTYELFASVHGLTHETGFDVDVLECPQCGGSFRITSLIDSADVMERILRQLKLWDDPRARLPSIS